jgi:uncharacterized protein YndB with AHSA1/START domain
MSRTAVTQANREAPVVGVGRIEIAAPVDAVWEVLTAIDGWPSWNPQVKAASLEGGLREGAEFRWKAGPGTITSRLTDVEAPRRIAWTGKTMGIKAIHVHTLEQLDGGTVVSTEESYDGLVSRLFRGRLQPVLDDALVTGLQHLKAEVERREAGREG